MKTVIILGDGMSDHPVDRLDGKTPLMVARKPHIDRIAREGATGLFETIPEGQSNGSAVANLSVLGYDPRVCFQGRGVLEAANMGVELGDEDVALRCNLICVDEGRIRNHSAGHIGTDEGTALIEALDAELGGDRGDQPVTFHPGISYRHLLVLRGGWARPEINCAPPHDHAGEAVADLMPTARIGEAASSAQRLVELHRAAAELLGAHPINEARVTAGLDPANWMWTWSPGRRPQMETYADRFGVRGAVISGVDLIMGLGVYAGMDVIRVPGATGLHDTNYEGKAQACLDALKDHDFVYVHVEATDEAGHSRDLDLKIRCIEYLDERLTRPILEGIAASGEDVRVAVLPDHPTPVDTGKHASDPVPVAVMGAGIEPDAVDRYDEVAVREGSLGTLTGEELIRLALNARP